MTMMTVQTRSESTGLGTYASIARAFEAAVEDPSIWKISWDKEDGSRVRMVRQGNTWNPEPLIGEVIQVFAAEETKALVLAANTILNFEALGMSFANKISDQQMNLLRQYVKRNET